ncbi:MAG: uridine diphosphate-N-acetylglucosamine-binding protein YvcK [Candidatus Moranbacteria bacterium]|nr:uridine diphosphate-N-acetylglucosamine-binding protein YvcK [Candidatus Moranbacteria bacterium]
MFKKNITFIGGTGASVIGKAAKKVPLWQVTLLVSLVDDGGSTGKLSKNLNIPPVGDIRKALSSLSSLEETMIKAIEYRFEKKELKGHTLGNLLLAGLIKNFQNNKDYNLNQVTEAAGKFLKIKGQVLTTTLKKTQLVAIFENGEKILGEHNLDENKDKSFGKPKKYYLIKKVPANPKAVKCLLKSDLIVFGPGDLGANTIAPVLTNGIYKSINKSRAKIIYIANLMTKCGETHDMTVNQCLEFLENSIKRKVDFVILNNGAISKEILQIYQTQDEKPLPFEIKELEKNRKVILADVLESKKFKKSKADKLRRSILRHNGEKVVEILKKI